MLFNSYAFLLLVSVTMVLYYAPALRRLQRFVLIGASFVFYAAHEPLLLLLLVCSISITATCSHYVHSGDPSRRRLYAGLGVALNLGTLAFFKYSPLFAVSFMGRTGSIAEFLIAVPLPIGISFFTFQSITLLVDSLRLKENRAAYDIPHGTTGEYATNTFLYVSFFPQLVAGPIVKAHDFLPQIGEKAFRGIDWEFCFRSLVTGYFLKMVIADNLKDQTFWIAYPYFTQRASIDLVAMLFGYSFQIFADFAGYSLIAIGVAALFGYRLPQNFNFPYISSSLAEFWRRWHISLSSFLKEYLYFPLGGNRKGAARTYFNLALVMLLGGLWHGAAWSYMVWGGCHGAALALERSLRDRFRVPDTGVVRAVRVITVFSFVSFAWLLFKLPTFSHVIAYLEAIWSNAARKPDLRLIIMIAIYALPVIAYHGHYLLKQAQVPYLVPRFAAVAYGTMLFLILSNSGSPAAFVYFQF